MAIEGYLHFEHVVFLLKNRFPFPLAAAFIIGIVSTNRQSGDKMLFLSLTAPNILAHLIDFLNKRREVNPQKYPQIRDVLPIQEINYGSANKLAQTCSFRQYCWALLYV